MQRKQAVYVIGAGPLGLETLKVARELGLAVLVSDKDPNAVGFAHADAYQVADGADIDAHVSLASGVDEDVVAVLCGAEFGARSVQAVEECLGLATNPAAAIERALDKEAMKLALVAEGVPTPQGASAETPDELASLLRACELAVVKPVAGSGSRGVRVVARDANPRAVFAAAIAAVPGESAVLVEPFIEGRSIDVNGILIDGELHPAGLLEKFTTPPPARLPLGGHDPVALGAAERDAAYDLLARAARAVGLVSGPVKGDLLWNDEGFTLLEIAPRFHGDVTTCCTLPYGSRIQPVRAWLRWRATGVLDPAELACDEQGSAIWRVLALPPGKLAALPSEALRAEHPDVTLVWHRFAVRDVLEPYADTTAIPGYVAARGRDPAAAEAALARWFEAAHYAVEPAPRHAAWYAELVRELERLGWDPAACGVPDSARRRAI